ncbi:MAG TPA: hypothetical protein VL068_02690 [Microthrixaceae bacterium]|nr:hypothetical protein [Microthrixaceae bacterium]
MNAAVPRTEDAAEGVGLVEEEVQQEVSHAKPGDRNREIFETGGRTVGVAGGVRRTLVVFNDTRRLPMAQILQSLNAEWSTIADSPSARRALMRWSATHPVFLPADDLAGVLELGYQPGVGPEVRRALASLASIDCLAARTLLQGLLGGLVNLARRVGRDADAVDDIVRLAWARIRTYPAHRPGSVSGNVLLDVRKGYCREQEQAKRSRDVVQQATLERSAEEHVLGREFLEELVIGGRQNGMSSQMLETIFRSRVCGDSMTDIAAEQQVSLKVLWHRRWRAEARLRKLLVAS